LKVFPIPVTTSNMFARSGGPLLTNRSVLVLGQAQVVSKIKIAKQIAGRQFVGKFGHNLPTLPGFTNIFEDRRIGGYCG
jgi:hypothetical protein